MTTTLQPNSSNPVVAKRSLKSATAKFATVMAVFGLAGTGLSAQAQAPGERTYEPVQMQRPQVQQLERHQVTNPDNMMRQQGVSEAFLALFDAALETGDSRAALERVRGLELTAEQREAFLSIDREEWAMLRDARRRLRPMERAADCTGTCGGFIY